MDAALKAALAGDATVFTAVRIDMPEFTLRLVSGGAVTIDGVAFPSWNDIYGSLISADPVSDGMDDQTTRASILLAPPTDQGLADLAAPMAQGSPVWLWKGAVDGNGACIGSPELLFQGELDFGRLRVDDSGWMLTIEFGTEEERQLEPDRARRAKIHGGAQNVGPARAARA
ncbi:MAG: hypothetical protein KA105_09830 [Caulobacter sp.]|nr:hypothetical protein [Caulobacter sp.]